MATHIQIGDISPRIQYTADGAQTAFTYPFPIFKDADVEVYEDATLKTLTTDYTVTGAGNSTGGTVTFNTAPAAAVVVTLKRALAIRRTTDFQESGEFRAKVINDELDYQTAVLQQVNDDLERSLRLADTDTAAALTLPDAATRASKYLGFDVSGLPIATDAAGPTGPVGPAGNMDGANNLSELTAPVTARANLGLVIGADVLSPTGDGSGLTGITTGATATEKANIMLNAFRIAVNGGLSVQNMVDGVSDEFSDQTGVGTNTNGTYNGAGYYENLSTNFVTPGLAITHTLGVLDIGVVGDLIDGNIATSVQLNGAATTHRFEITLATAATLSTLNFYLSNNDANRYSGTRVYTYDGATWTLRGSEGAIETIGWHTLAFAAVTGATRVAFEHDQGAGVNIRIAEYAAYGTGPTLDMTLVSNAATALAQPDNVFAVLRQQDVDAVTPNTDLTFEASRDDGVTWTAATLFEVSTDGTVRILTGSANVAAQPVGASMKWRIKTLNNKAQKIHAVGLEWS